jgi:hypothetical protein
MATIRVQQDGLSVGNFAIVAGITNVYQNIAFTATDASQFQASFPGIDEYLLYTVDTTDYGFPASLADIENTSGSLTVAIPSDFADGRHIIKMRVAAEERRSLPICGRCVAGKTKMLPYPNISAYNGILPYITITSFYTTPAGTPASSAEKLAVINVLKDWDGDTDAVLSPIFAHIDALDIDTSSSEEIYQAYLEVLYVKRNIGTPDMSNALRSILNEVQQWQDI